MFKKICIVLGSRANYSSIKSVMQSLKSDNNFKLQIVLTTSSVLERYGDVSKLVKKDDFVIDQKIYNLVEFKNFRKIY